MVNNTDQVRALAELVDAAALMLCDIDTCGHPVDPAYRATLHDAWTKGQAALASALASAPPSAPVGVDDLRAGRDIVGEFLQCANVGRVDGKLIAQAKDWLAWADAALAQQQGGRDHG